MPLENPARPIAKPSNGSRAPTESVAHDVIEELPGQTLHLQAYGAVMAGDPIAVRAAADARNPDSTVETARGETAGRSCSYRRPPGRLV